MTVVRAANWGMKSLTPGVSYAGKPAHGTGIGWTSDLLPGYHRYRVWGNINKYGPYYGYRGGDYEPIDVKWHSPLTPLFGKNIPYSSGDTKTQVSVGPMSGLFKPGSSAGMPWTVLRPPWRTPPFVPWTKLKAPYTYRRPWKKLYRGPVKSRIPWAEVWDPQIAWSGSGNHPMLKLYKPGRWSYRAGGRSDDEPTLQESGYRRSFKSRLNAQMRRRPLNCYV